jgi:hypothetical protein
MGLQIVFECICSYQPPRQGRYAPEKVAKQIAGLNTAILFCNKS